MEHITLDNVCPNIFASQKQLQSQVWNTHLTLEKGRFYLIEACSGGGKSSLCSYLLGFRNDYRGNICYDNSNVRNFDIERWTEVRRQHISLLFQELRLFPELTALENVKIKNQLTGHKSIDEIKEWFEQLGIADKMQTPVGRMSFGQQQRVALMRSLAQPFDFLLADEAVSHLDEQNARIVGELMTTEARKQGAAILATSIGHHVPLAYDETLQL